MLSRVQELRDSAYSAYGLAVKTSYFNKENNEDRQKYMERYRKAISLLRQIDEKYMTEMDHVRLAVCHGKLQMARMNQAQDGRQRRRSESPEVKLMFKELNLARDCSKDSAVIHLSDDAYRQQSAWHAELAYDYYLLGDVSLHSYDNDHRGAMGGDASIQYTKAIDILKMIRMENRTDEDNRRIAKIYQEMTYLCFGFLSREDHFAKIDAYKGVIAALSMVKSRNENDYITMAKYYIKLGDGYLSIDNLAEAISYYQLPLAMVPDMQSPALSEVYPVVISTCHNALGGIYFETHDNIKARHHFRHAIKEFNKHIASQAKNGQATLSYNNKHAMSAYESSLAFVYSSLNDSHRAAKHFHRAVNIFCENESVELNDQDSMKVANLHRQLGNIYVERNDQPKAIAEYVRAISLMNRIKASNEVTKFNLAMCYQELGDIYLKMDYYGFAVEEYNLAANMFRAGIYVHLPELVAKIIRGYTIALTRWSEGKYADCQLRELAHNHAQLAFLNSRLGHPLENPDQSEVIRQYRFTIEMLNNIDTPSAEDRRALAEAHSNLREIYSQSGKNMKAIGEGVHVALNRVAGSFTRGSNNEAKSALRRNSIYHRAAKTEDAQKDQDSCKASNRQGKCG